VSVPLFEFSYPPMLIPFPSRRCSVGMTNDVPFLLETELKALGGKYEKAPEAWASWVVADGNLYTGQNPASAGPLAEKIKQDLS
jgi:putative intracellular protease/amidase